MEPRPYQLVPLLMALRLDPVRLLIADDVGIGKTIEAALVARELLDRGEVRRFAVLCPPHLAEQWQQELAEKFHIDATLVLSSTIQRLERNLPLGVSVFDRHPFVIISTDFIKARGRRDDFINRCPELVIVDEAHGCAPAGGRLGSRHERFELVSRLAEDENRNLILVTATPHSGNESAFRSLLGILDRGFESLPDDISREERAEVRQKLARHLVQRRRADIRHYLETDTSFPTRLDKEETYAFSPEYKKLFSDVVDFALDFVSEGKDGERRHRVRYWSALALLRCFSSSPAAAIATLRNRSATDEAETTEQVNEIGTRTVLDQDDTDEAAVFDVNPGSVSEDAAESLRRRQLDFAKRAEALLGEKDAKLQKGIKEVRSLLEQGHRPIVFCRFIETADYVARQLRESRLPRGTEVEAITGALPPKERETRIEALTQAESYVLVCTDCLSEGVNLQDSFDAVIHYDLCWNPTRHEQREGRVDRFGQQKSDVRVLTYYGEDNAIDGVILDVLLRKHKQIKNDLGVSVSVPGSSEDVAKTIFEGLLFRERTGQTGAQLLLKLDDLVEKEKQQLHSEWENIRAREKANRSRFAQHALKPEFVAEELAEVRRAIGSPAVVAAFLKDSLAAARVPLRPLPNDRIEVGVSPEIARSLRQALGRDDAFIGAFDLPLGKGEHYLGRTSPIVEGLASHVLDQALDPGARDGRAVAARCGVAATASVDSPTTMVLARFRYHLRPRASSDETLLCEEIVPLAFRGSAATPTWLEDSESEQLFEARPDGNVPPTVIEQQLANVFTSLPDIQAALAELAESRAELQRTSHERVRVATRTRSKAAIEPVLPVDVLGVFKLLPV